MGTVVETWKSAPRQPGAAMLVGPDGTAVGSVSGGCVEGAVFDLAARVRDGGQPVLQRYGVSDDDAFAVGLTCGGIIDVFVEPISRATIPDLDEIADDIRAGRPVAVATIVAGVDRLGRHLVIRPDRRVEQPGRSAARRRRPGRRSRPARAGTDCGIALRRQRRTPTRRPQRVRLLLRASPANDRLRGDRLRSRRCPMGSFLGYRVTVCDARATFATARRFPDADEVVVEWPHRYLANTDVDGRTVLAVLTHDPKFDVPLLELALRLPVAYVGAMGSRRTNEDRLDKLRERGLTSAELARLHAPIGLDLGARTPEETAVSIAAELIGQRWGGSGRALRTVAGPIHRDRLADSAAPDGRQAGVAARVAIAREPTVQLCEPAGGARQRRAMLRS